MCSCCCLSLNVFLHFYFELTCCWTFNKLTGMSRMRSTERIGIKNVISSLTFSHGPDLTSGRLLQSADHSPDTSHTCLPCSGMNSSNWPGGKRALYILITSCLAVQATSHSCGCWWWSRPALLARPDTGTSRSKQLPIKNSRCVWGGEK